MARSRSRYSPPCLLLDEFDFDRRCRAGEQYLARPGRAEQGPASNFSAARLFLFTKRLAWLTLSPADTGPILGGTRGPAPAATEVSPACCASAVTPSNRSEERRVGKECRTRRWTAHDK